MLTQGVIIIEHHVYYVITLFDSGCPDLKSAI